MTEWDKPSGPWAAISLALLGLVCVVDVMALLPIDVTAAYAVVVALSLLGRNPLLTYGLAGATTLATLVTWPLRQGDAVSAAALLSQRAVAIGGIWLAGGLGLRLLQERRMREREAMRRSKTQEELRVETDFIRGVLDTIAALVIVLDSSGRIVRFNRACERLTGRRFEDLQGQRFWEVLLPDDEIASVREVFARLRRGDFPNEHENHWVDADGNKRLIAWSNTALVGEAGQVRFVIGTGVDVTERRRAEESLIHSQKMDAVGRLAAGLAHDFNNLLTGLIGCCEGAKSSLKPGSPCLSYIDEIDQAARAGVSVTRQLLDFSMKRSVPVQPMQLLDVLHAQEAFLRQTLGDTIELRIDLASNLPFIVGDPAQIEQIFVNLTLNARNAMPDGGVMDVAARAIELHAGDRRLPPSGQPGTWVLVTVRDTGCGMDQETLTRAFEPFFTTRAHEGGTGLGLSMVFGIVRRYGGHIWIDSTEERGTAFHLLFPTASEPEPTPETSPPALPADRPLDRAVTVLVAEDQKLVRRSIRKTLEALGYRVLEAADANEAIRAHETDGPVDLLLTDMVMNGRSGTDLARDLMSRQQDLAVVYMSAYPYDYLVAEGHLEPGLTSLEKPFTKETLQATVRRALAARTRHRD